MLRDFLTTTQVDQVAKGSSPPLDARAFRLRIKVVVRILDGVLTMTLPHRPAMSRYAMHVVGFFWHSRVEQQQDDRSIDPTDEWYRQQASFDPSFQSGLPVVERFDSPAVFSEDERSSRWQVYPWVVK